MFDVQGRQHIPVKLAGVAGVNGHAVQQQEHFVAGAKSVSGGAADVDLIADKIDTRRRFQRLNDIDCIAALNVARGNNGNGNRCLIQILLCPPAKNNDGVHFYRGFFQFEFDSGFAVI